MTKIEPEDVFSNVPKIYEAAYHWINVGVSSDLDSRQNPFNMLKDNYKEDDLIIVKLDIDTPHVENVLARQMRDDPQLANLIDHFYFEHHVHLKELEDSWGTDVKGSVADSLRLFHGLRKAGVAAHSWV